MPQIVYADINPARVDEVRRMMPALEHDKEYRLPASG